jgi:hypothetical protein
MRGILQLGQVQTKPEEAKDKFIKQFGLSMDHKLEKNYSCSFHPSEETLILSVAFTDFSKKQTWKDSFFFDI